MPLGKKAGAKIILGIDPGVADTGYGLVRCEANSFTALNYGSIKTDKKLGLADRIFEIEKEVQKLIKKYRPDSISIEKLFFCNNAKTAFAVGQARGVILFAARDNNLPILEFTPLQVKMAVTGYGKAEKKQIQQMVKIILNLKEIPKPDDAADALAVAICGANNKY